MYILVCLFRGSPFEGDWEELFVSGVMVWRRGTFSSVGDLGLSQCGEGGGGWQCLCVWQGAGGSAGVVCGVCLHRRGGGGMVLCVGGGTYVFVCMLGCVEESNGACVNVCSGTHVRGWLSFISIP